MPVLLTLESDGWRLEIAGLLRIPPSFIQLPNDSAFEVKGEASLRVISQPSGELVEVPETAAGAAPVFFENTAYDCYVNCPSGEAQLELPPGTVFRNRIGEFTHYALSFGNDVGFSELTVSFQGKVVRLRFEVFPTKIDYRLDYQTLRDEVAAMARSLAMTVQARTFGSATPTVSNEPTLAEWIALINHYFEQFVRAANSVIANPHMILSVSTQRTKTERARRVAERKLERRMRRPVVRGEGRTADGLQLPSFVPEQKKRTTYDTIENRYFKFLLFETLRRLQQIAVAKETGDEDADLSAEQKFFEALRPRAAAMMRKLQGLLSAPFLQNLHPELPKSMASPVLTRHPAYAAFLQSARLLNSGLSLGGGVLQIGVKNIAQLYEYWCFLRLVRLFRNTFQLQQQSLVQIRHLRLVIVLAKGKEAAVSFKEAVTGKTLFLLYDRMFKGLPTVSQRPDNVIQLASEDSLYILDAKYRLSYEPEYVKIYGGVGPKVDDINTMHRYRDAIVLEHPMNAGQFKRGVVQGAAVLFPFKNEQDYMKHRFFRSLLSVQIGGLPFLPGATALAEDHVRSVLKAEGYQI